MSKSKAKGTRAENEVVKLLGQAGIQAERIPLSGSLGGKYSGDVVIGSVDNPSARIEVKNRESIADYLWEWLEQGKADYLVVRKNHRSPLVVMSFDQWTALLNRSTDHSGGDSVD